MRTPDVDACGLDVNRPKETLREHYTYCNNFVVVAWLAHRELLRFPHAAALCADWRHTKCGMGGIRTTTEALPPALYSTEDTPQSVHCNRNENISSI
jgi:hypothetical protein